MGWKFFRVSSALGASCSFSTFVATSAELCPPGAEGASCGDPVGQPTTFLQKNWGRPKSERDDSNQAPNERQTPEYNELDVNASTTEPAAAGNRSSSFPPLAPIVTWPSTTPSMVPVHPPVAFQWHDYDCDGDGGLDCYVWDYQMSMCQNRMHCGHFYKFPDTTLDQSCRCRKCSKPDYVGTAFLDPLLLEPKAEELAPALPWGTYRNWADHLDTCAPWLMPKDDGALQNFLMYAMAKNYRVRISGAGHSSGGIVTDGKDPNVFVISLGEYKAPIEWEFSWRGMPDGSYRARVNAGWTQLNLYEKIRPFGYFLPAQTAGYFFQLGGIVANSVHGGTYNEGFVHSYATAMRVMFWNGTIRVIDDESEVRYWRCSFGLLGIILGIEFQLVRRESLQMYTVVKDMGEWSADNFWKFIKQDAEADVPVDIVPEGGDNGTRKAWNGEFFFDFLNERENHPFALVYAQKANESVDAGGDPNLTEEALRTNYWTLLTKPIMDTLHGGMSYSQAARRDGAPPIEIAGSDVNNMLEGLKHLHLAKFLSHQAITNIPRFVTTMRNSSNDGFFLVESPASLAAAYFIKPEYAFAAMDFLRTTQLQSVGHQDFVWNLPGESRFIRVQDSAVLQPVPPGLWFNTQMISFKDLAENDQAWKKDFKKVEDYWVKELGAKPHMGKLWGFEEQAGGEVQPFAEKFACKIYTDEAKAAFETYRYSADPDGLFSSGLGMQLLGPCPDEAA